MFSLLGAILFSALIASLYLSLVFGMSVLNKDRSVLNASWGLGFVVIALGFSFALDDIGSYFELTKILIAIWGVRLFAHIVKRNSRAEKQAPEQPRLMSYLKDYMLQALLMTAIAMPMLVAATDSTKSLNALAWIGAAVWLTGFIFEVVGDRQLSDFLSRQAKKTSKKTKKRKKSGDKPVMTTGLWRYTRHPNYFGEIAQWWGLFIIVVQLNNGWLAIVSPLIITFLLLRVTGITVLESRFEGNKKFDHYKQRTSALIPMVPKR